MIGKGYTQETLIQGDQSKRKITEETKSELYEKKMLTMQVARGKVNKICSAAEC